MRYRVYGHTTVTVTTKVNADNESEAYENAYNNLCFLSAYAGNGGLDKLIGVDGEHDSASADGEIIYDDIEEIGPDEDED